MDTPEFKVTDALLKYARGLRESEDPAVARAAASWEVRFQEDLELLRRAATRKKPEPARAGG
jgi:hypothetical protein